MYEFNFHDLTSLIVKKGWFILSAALIFAVAFYLWASSRPNSYDVSLSFTINLTNKQQTQDYQYDGYYAIRASELLGETIISWFLTPSEVIAIYKQAGLELPKGSLIEITRRFKTSKFSGQNIVVKFTAPDEAAASKLAQAVADYVEEKAESLNKDSQGQSLFDIVPSEPVIILAQNRVGLITGLAFAAGMIIAFAVMMMLETARKGKGEYANRN